MKRVNDVSLIPVNAGNWHDVFGLEVTGDQMDFVMTPGYYLNLCHYGNLWKPLAVTQEDGAVIGFLMWAIDDADNSCWLGGIIIDRDRQGRGFGEAAVRAAISMLSEKHGYGQFALSYNPSNTGARHLYAKIGFVETGETEDDEIVARLNVKSAT